MSWKAYFKRGTTSCDGLFTLQYAENGKVISKPFDRIHARSGAPSFYNTEWVGGKSPIPRGTFHLWLASNNRGQDAGSYGIGEFFPISSDDSKIYIREDQCAGWGPHPVGVEPRKRSEIGLHEENKWKGTAGCIAIVNTDDFDRIKAFLHKLGVNLTDLEIEVF